MNISISLDSVYVPSEDIVSRDIVGKRVIVPIGSGIGDIEDEIYMLNETGRAIWDKLDGEKSLQEIAETLAVEYNAPTVEVKKDVLGIVAELFRRKMVVAVEKD
ncbi:MAG: PqqD family protein [Methanoregula sp.]|nr:PqqD family protein [Methanoregula sp.]